MIVKEQVCHRAAGRRSISRMVRLLIAVTIFVLTAAGPTVSPLSGQAIPVFPDSDRAPRVRATAPTVESIFRAWAEREHLPGFAYGVVLDGELVYAEGFGMANLERDLTASPETLFRIASMSKSFTAMSILQLRDAGKLRL
ncbi:MAG: serine hydrolase, partial [Gemmatimonadota bacterium]